METNTNTYDVIVIGAGNGGLVAAATTAQSGLKTLLLEKNTLPGGCATSFRRGRFEFEASLHELANIGTPENPGSIRKLFESFGADILWVSDSIMFRTIADGKDGYDVTMPVGVEAFCEEMERQVPGSYAGTKALFDCSRKVGEAIRYLSSGKPDPSVLMAEHADFLRMASHSVDVCLETLEIPQKAQNILKTYWPYLGTPTHELDFAHYVLMLERYVMYGPGFPAHRSHELSLALEDVIRKSGGEVWHHAEAERILVKNNAAYGVVVNGVEFYAKHIIANCWPDVAYTGLLSEDEVPDRARQLANAREDSLQFFNVYLGLDRSVEELGIRDYSVFLYDSPDAGEQYEACLDAAHSPVIATCLNRVIPDASPEGTCMLVLTSFLRKEAWDDVKPEDYKDLKNKIAKRMIETYERRLAIPVFAHIEEVVIAAPPTFARYLGTPGGTPYGYVMQDFDNVILRIMNSKKDQTIQNLTFVGAHAERGAGYSSAYANGNSAAKKIVKEEAACGK